MVPCKQSRYSPNLSYTHLSKLNIERLVLLDEGEKDQVKEEFEQARETLQRVKQKIVRKDSRKMNNIIRLGHQLESLLFEATNIYTNYSTYSDHNNVMDILGSAFNYVDHDFEYYCEKIERAKAIASHYNDYDTDLWPIMYLTVIGNSRYPLHERLIECIAEGLDESNDTELVTEAYEYITTISPSESTEAAIDENQSNETVADENRELISDVQLIYPGLQSPSRPNVQPRIFNIKECDYDIFYGNSVRAFSQNLKQHIINSMETLPTWYESLTDLYPINIIETHPYHHKCLQIMNWINSTGIETLDIYFSLVEELKNVIEEIPQSYESRSKKDTVVDSADSNNNFTIVVNEVYRLTSELNDLISSEEMQIMLIIANQPHLQRDPTNDHYTVPDTFADENNTHICLWLYRDVFKYHEKKLTADVLNMYFQLTHNQFRDTFSILSNQLLSTNKFYQSKIKPDITKFEQYMARNRGKLEVARDVTNMRSKKNTDDFINKINELEDLFDELDDLIQAEAEKAIALLDIPINLSVPLLEYSTMNETITGQQIARFKDDPIVGYSDQDMQEHFQDTFLQVQRKHYDRTRAVFHDLHHDLADGRDELVDELDEERDMLRLYMTSTLMDDEFYM